MEMLKAKQEGHAPAKEKAASSNPSVINLMEALKRSLVGTSTPTPPPRDVLKPRKAKQRLEGQREMLLPIAGKGPTASVAKA